MNQRRGLERLTRRLRGHLCHSQFAEFIVNQWQKFLSRLWIPLLDAIEDLRHVAHETARYQNGPAAPAQTMGASHGATETRTTADSRMRAGAGTARTACPRSFVIC